MKSFWQGKRVFLTGHTGFKGAWLSQWLLNQGALVRGYALKPATEPNLFTALNLRSKLEHVEGDIRKAETLIDQTVSFKPDVVFHLAAQALVGPSYKDPVDTYSTNVMGTLHVLEAIRRAETVRATVIVTTDKCYENRGWPYPYRETDPLGGADIYSSSKACAEIVSSSYARSFLNAREGFHIATARAGNVVGGGDYSDARIVPDVVRAVQTQTTLVLRRPQATRPWQHVLEPLGGYLTLAEHLWSATGEGWRGGWNFGPSPGEERPVIDLVTHAKTIFPKLDYRVEAPPFEEAHFLTLDSAKARHELRWQPRWDFPTTMRTTLDWYRRFADGEPAEVLTLADIRAYEAAASL